MGCSRGADWVWCVGAGRGGSVMFSMTEPGMLSFSLPLSSVFEDLMEVLGCVFLGVKWRDMRRYSVQEI